MNELLVVFSVGLNIVVLIAIVCIWIIKDRLKSRIVGSQAERKQSQFNLLESTSADAVFLGDSLTEGGLWHEFFPNQHVVNRGISGDASIDVLNRINQVVYLQPKKLFIMVGINDLNRKIELASIITNYYDLFEIFERQLPDTQVFIQSILPVGSHWLYTRNDYIKKLNHELDILATKYGHTFINLHNLFIDDAGKLKSALSNDGLHLLGEGYRIWKKAIEAYV